MLESTEEPKEKLLSLAEAAQELGVSQSYLRFLIFKKKLRGQKIGRKLKVTRSALHEYFSSIDSYKVKLVDVKTDLQSDVKKDNVDPSASLPVGRSSERVPLIKLDAKEPKKPHKFLLAFAFFSLSLLIIASNVLPLKFINIQYAGLNNLLTSSAVELGDMFQNAFSDSISDYYSSAQDAAKVLFESIAATFNEDIAEAPVKEESNQFTEKPAQKASLSLSDISFGLHQLKDIYRNFPLPSFDIGPFISFSHEVFDFYEKSTSSLGDVGSKIISFAEGSVLSPAVSGIKGFILSEVEGFPQEIMHTASSFQLRSASIFDSVVRTLDNVFSKITAFLRRNEEPSMPADKNGQKPQLTKEETELLSDDELTKLKEEINQLKEQGITANTPIKQPSIIEKTIFQTIGGLSEEEVDKKLNNVNNALLAQIADLKDLIASNASRSSSNARIVQLSQRIDDLANVTLRNITVNGVTGLTNADIPNDITVSALLNYLPLSGGTLTGNLTGTDITLSGNLTVTGVQTFSGALTVSSFSATSTTATSTIAGGLNVGSGGLVYDFSSGNVGIGTTSPAFPFHVVLPDDGSKNAIRFEGLRSATGGHAVRIELLAPNSPAPADAKNFEIININNQFGDTANAFSIRQRNDAGSSATGLFAISHGGSSPGGVLIGTYAHTLTAAAPANGLVVSGNLGIGTTSPAELLSVHGNALIAGTTTVKALIATSTLFVGDTTGSKFIVNGDGNVGIGNAADVTFTGETSADLTVSIGNDQDSVDELTKLQIFGRELSNDTDVAIIEFANRRESPAKHANAQIRGLRGSSIDDGHLDFYTMLAGTMTRRVRIEDTGNVGIGTTSPYANLSIAGSAGQTTDVFAISTSSSSFATSTAFVVDSQGNVGIGTAGPQGLLHVHGDLGANVPIVVINNTRGSSSNSRALRVQGGAGVIFEVKRTDNDFMQLSFDTSSNAVWTTNENLKWDVNGDTRMMIDTSGNIGIGTTTPTSLLNIAGATAPKITISDTDASDDQKHWFIESDTGSFNIGTTSDALITNTSYRALTIDSAGNVGIGTASPNVRLHIVTAGTPTTIELEDATFPRGNIIGIEGSDNIVIGADEDDLGAGSEIQFRLDGSQKMVIEDGGNLGIGTTSPGALLSVAGATDGTTPLFIIGTSSTALANQTAFIVDSQGFVGVGTAAPGAELDIVGDSPVLQVDASGNTVSPAIIQLDADRISATAISGQLKFFNNGATPVAEVRALRGSSDTAGDLRILTAGLVVAHFDENGNLGIGTTSPSQLLSVQGNILTSATTTTGGLTATGTVFLATDGGNVGIGTVEPTQPLHVVGSEVSLLVQSGTGDAVARFQSTDVNARIELIDSSDTGFLFIQSNKIGLGFEGTLGTFSNGIVIQSGGNVGIASTTPTGLFSIENTGSSPTVYISDELNDTTPFVIDDAGNVGIGTEAPATLLEIINASGDADLRITTTGINDAQIIFRTSDDNDWLIYSDADDSDKFKIDNLDGGGNVLTFQNNGNLGIGTTSPSSLLSVQGGALIAGTTTVKALIATSTLFVGDTTGSKFIVNGDGNVGIGTVNPTSPSGYSNILNIGGDVDGALVISETSTGQDWEIGIQSSGKFFITEEGNDVLTIDTSGNVGIGTTSPSSGLLSVENTGSGYTFYATDDTDDITPFVIDASGLVGIGTVNPGFALTLGSGKQLAFKAETGDKIYLTDTSNAGGRLTIAADANDVMRFQFGADSGGAFRFTKPTSSSDATAIDLVRIDSSGNVGIGTTTPTSLLNVAGATAPKITISDTNASTDQKHWFIESDTGSFNIGTTSDALITNTSYRALTIDSTGNVGIGTTSPSIETLHIAGGGGNLGIRLTNTGSGGGDFAIDVEASAGGGGFSIVDRAAGIRRFVISPNGNIQLGLAANTNPTDLAFQLTATTTSSISYIAVDRSGNVGIASTTPTGLFSIENTGSDPTVYISDELNDTTPFVIDASGNVIIGTPTQATNAELTVTGDTDISGTMALGSGASVSSTAVLNLIQNFLEPDATVRIMNGQIGSVIETTGATANLVKGSDWTLDLGALNTQDWTATVGFRAYDGQIRLLSGSTGVVTGAASFYVTGAAVSGATLTNQYGLYVSDLTTGQNNYAVYTDGTTKSYFGGNVGIGTTTPTSLLNIAGATAPKITISDTDASEDQKHWFIESDTGSFNIGTTSDALITNTSYRALTIDSAGEVGIGTASPEGSLDINTPDGIIPLILRRPGASAQFINIYGGSSLLWYIRSSGTIAGNPFIIGNNTEDFFLIRGDNGNVGIGTTSPSGRLTISALNEGDTSLHFTATSTANDFTYDWIIGADRSDAGKFKISSSTALGTNDRFVIDGNGNVGIGTASPGTKLEVSSTGETTLTISGNIDSGSDRAILAFNRDDTSNTNASISSTAEISGDYGIIRFDTQGASGLLERMRINSSGNVGIGTTTPLSLLNLHQVAITAGSSTPVFQIDTDDTGNATDIFAQFISDYDATNDIEYAFLTNGSAHADTAWVGGGADVAEYMTAQNPESLSPGDLLIVDENTDAMVKKSDGTPYDERIIGVISTNPGLIAAGGEVESSKDNQVLVALAGRVPLKVNLEGGTIKKGDRLTSSSISGQAMSAKGGSASGGKATSSAFTIGIALENFNKAPEETGTILVFINLTYSQLSPDIKEGTIAAEAMRDLNGSDLINVGAINGLENKWSIDASGRLIVEEIKTKKLEVEETATFGTPQNPQGITIYDEDTGEAYCLKIKSGSVISILGTCRTSAEANLSATELTPEIIEEQPPVVEEEVNEPPPETTPEPEQSPAIEDPSPESSPAIEEPQSEPDEEITSNTDPTEPPNTDQTTFQTETTAPPPNEALEEPPTDEPTEPQEPPPPQELPPDEPQEPTQTPPNEPETQETSQTPAQTNPQTLNPHQNLPNPPQISNQNPSQPPKKHKHLLQNSSI